MTGLLFGLLILAAPISVADIADLTTGSLVFDVLAYSGSRVSPAGEGERFERNLRRFEEFVDSKDLGFLIALKEAVAATIRPADRLEYYAAISLVALSRGSAGLARLMQIQEFRPVLRAIFIERKALKLAQERAEADAREAEGGLE